MASLHIHRLLDHPGMIDTVAGWIDAEWGAFSGRTLDRTRTRFTEDAAAALPRSYVALAGAVPLGVASLRARDSVDWDPGAALRSEARRAGEECVSTCISRWTPHLSKNTHTKIYHSNTTFIL